MAAESNLSALAEALGPCARRDAPLAPFTSIRVGGPADIFVVAGSQDELVHAVRLARHYDVPWRVLGSGCNVLIADEGVRGLVVANRAESISIKDGLVQAESGTKLTVLAQRAVEAGLEGVAWAAGLPGTVGGAVVGNAGAFEGDVAGVLGSATLLEPDDEVRERPNTWFEFRYRGSRLKGRRHDAAEDDSGRGEAADRGYVVLEAALDLKPGNRAALRARAEEILTWRRTRHPSGATMGSTFKNPPGGRAGRLIERAGLKGLRMGGAQISEQHANFFVNVGDATAADVWALIERARAEVRRKFGVVLELEIEPLGWDGSVMNRSSTKGQGTADGNR